MPLSVHKITATSYAREAPSEIKPQVVLTTHEARVLEGIFQRTAVEAGNKPWQIVIKIDARDKEAV